MIKISLWFPLILLTACTLSFSNISTNGKASDVFDEEQTPTSDITATANIPAI